MRPGLGASLCFVVVLGSADVAVAGNGWYLLIPPRSEYNERAAFLSSYRILDDKPLSKWAQQKAYDAASECEAAKDRLTLAEHRTYSLSAEAYIRAAGAGAEASGLKMQRLLTETDNANVSALMASRCVRSDDARLLRPVAAAADDMPSNVAAIWSAAAASFAALSSFLIVADPAT